MSDMRNPIDLAWVLVATALVFLTQAGFLCIETGLVRSKNSINVAIKNLADLCLGGMVFWGLGYGPMLGTTRAGLVGVGTPNPLVQGGSAVASASKGL